MTRLIRRHSMERLQLYDLEKLIAVPPLPPPRQTLERRTSMNPAYERYKFLCNMSRAQKDPVYAATPMFTTIPQSSQVKPHRQLLGSYMRLENVRPLLPKVSKSPEPNSAEMIEEEKEIADTRAEDSQSVDEKNNDGNNDDDNDRVSTDGNGSNDEDGREKNNDDDEVTEGEDKGVVEQLFENEKKPETNSTS